MKHNFSTIKLMTAAAFGALAILSAPAADATDNTQSRVPLFTGVGPAVAGSVNQESMPAKAIHFLEHHFANVTVSQCVKDFDDNAYEVDLADGTDIEFDSKGEWREVEAPDGEALSAEVVTKLLPRRAYSTLKDRGYNESVESVKRGRGGYVVEFTNNLAVNTDYTFDNAGHLLGLIP